MNRIMNYKLSSNEKIPTQNNDKEFCNTLLTILLL